MESKKKSTYYSKAKIKLEDSKFLDKIEAVTYSDLKRWNLINSKVFNESIQKKIRRDYEGDDVNE